MSPSNCALRYLDADKAERMKKIVRKKEIENRANKIKNLLVKLWEIGNLSHEPTKNSVCCLEHGMWRVKEKLSTWFLKWIIYIIPGYTMLCFCLFKYTFKRAM